MDAEVPAWPPNDHPNPSQGRQKGFRNSHILKKIQVLSNIQNNSNFGAFGGARTRATWAPKHPHCNQMITQTHPGADRRILEKVEFSGEKIRCD